MINRREFIRKTARGLALSGIIAGGGYLLLKPQTGEACTLDFVCKDCKRLKACVLPEAETYKKENESTIQ